MRVCVFVVWWVGVCVGVLFVRVLWVMCFCGLVWGGGCCWGGGFGVGFFGVGFCGVVFFEGVFGRRVFGRWGGRGGVDRRVVCESGLCESGFARRFCGSVYSSDGAYELALVELGCWRVRVRFRSLRLRVCVVMLLLRFVVQSLWRMLLARRVFRGCDATL